MNICKICGNHIPTSAYCPDCGAKQKAATGDPPSVYVRKDKLDKLQEVIREYIAWIQSDDFHQDSDWDHYIYEAAVEAFCGDEFWPWYRRVSA